MRALYHFRCLGRGALFGWMLFAFAFALPAQAQLGPPPVPPQNPMTAEKVLLGKALFWEEQLSLTGTVACGTCHRNQAGGSDPRTALAGPASVHPGPDEQFGTRDDIHGSAGVVAHDQGGNLRPAPYFALQPQVGGRLAPSVYDAAFAPRLFWDGRAEGAFVDPDTGQTLIPSGGALEIQSLQPLVNTAEMGHAGNLMEHAAERIVGVIPLALATDLPPELAAFIGQRGYPALFAETFGTPEVTEARIAFALASYQRELSKTVVPWDLESQGTPTLTAQELEGRLQFQRLRCQLCHAGARHADNSFRYIGVRPVDEDLGRFNQTGNANHRGAFRVPSLRNVALRGPFMHNGGLATLDEVLSFYKRGGDFDAPNKDGLIGALFLNDTERADLLAYLTGALTDPRILAEQPPYDRPTLYSESDRVPELLGAGSGGGLGVPRISALEPPHVGNQNFTIALSEVAVGAQATLVLSYSDPGVQATVPVAEFASYSAVAVPMVGFSNGYLSAQVDLSAVPAGSGQTLYGRYYVVDPSAPNQLAVSEAIRFSLFGSLDRFLADGFE